MTKLINSAIMVFSILSIGLGAQAYFAPREGHDASLISLIAGGGIGLLMLLSLYIWKAVSPRGGRIFSSVLCLLCLGRFIPSWLSKGFYPNGLMAVLAGILLVLLVAGHLAARAEKSAQS